MASYTPPGSNNKQSTSSQQSKHDDKQRQESTANTTLRESSSNQLLSEELQLSTIKHYDQATTAESEHFDVVIIGGGPAGSSCALWLKMLGFKPCIIEKRHQLGGLGNDNPYPNEWIVAISGLTGAEVALSMHNHILSHGIRCFLESNVTQVQRAKTGFQIEFEDREKVHRLVASSFVVIASGVIPATGNLQETQHLLIGPGHKISNHDFTNKSVAILGGGDNAFENYEFIKAQQASYVHIYVRTDKEHGIRASQEFFDRVPATDIRQHQGACQIDTVANTVNGEKYDRIVVLYGWTTFLPFMENFKIEKNAKGFVTTNNATCETSETGIYAIGEVAQRVHPCCVTAMADGVVAAKSIQRKLELKKKQILQ